MTRCRTTTRARADRPRERTQVRCRHDGAGSAAARPDHGDRAGPARGQLGAVRCTHPARGGPARRRAGGRRGQLTLGTLVAAHRDPDGLREVVEQAMASIGMQVHTSIETGDDPAARRRSTHVVLVLGRPITARAFGRSRGTGRARGEHRRDPARRRLSGHRPGAARLGPADTAPHRRHAARPPGRGGRARPASTWPWSAPGWPGAASGWSCSTSTPRSCRAR